MLQALKSIHKLMRQTQFRVKAWAGLLTMIFNALCIQTHVHLVSPAVDANVSSALSADIDSCSSSTHVTHQDHCAWCQAVAQVGTYLPPASTTLLQAIYLTASAEPMTLTPTHSLLPSYFWRSRAPPV